MSEKKEKSVEEVIKNSFSGTGGGGFSRVEIWFRGKKLREDQ